MPDACGKDKLHDMIVAAIALADSERHYSVAALLSEALDMLARDASTSG